MSQLPLSGQTPPLTAPSQSQVLPLQSLTQEPPRDPTLLPLLPQQQQSLLPLLPQAQQQKPWMPQVQPENPVTIKEQNGRLQMLVAMFKSRNMELLQENNRLRTDLENSRQQLMLVQNGGGDAHLLTKILKEMTLFSMGRPTFGIADAHGLAFGTRGTAIDANAHLNAPLSSPGTTSGGAVMSIADTANVPVSQALVFSAEMIPSRSRSPEGEVADRVMAMSTATAGDAKRKALEFFAELEDMPVLPGMPRPLGASTVQTSSGVLPGASASKSASQKEPGKIQVETEASTPLPCIYTP